MAIARVSVEIRAPGTVFGEKLSPPTRVRSGGGSLSTRYSEPSKGSPPEGGHLFLYCICGAAWVDASSTRHPYSPLAAAALFGSSQAGWRLLRPPAQQFSGNTERLKTLLVTCSNRGVSISLGCSRRSGDPPVVYLISADLGGSQTFFALHLPRPSRPPSWGWWR